MLPERTADVDESSRQSAPAPHRGRCPRRRRGVSDPEVLERIVEGARRSRRQPLRSVKAAPSGTLMRDAPVHGHHSPPAMNERPLPQLEPASSMKDRRSPATPCEPRSPSRTRLRTMNPYTNPPKSASMAPTPTRRMSSTILASAHRGRCVSRTRPARGRARAPSDPLLRRELQPASMERGPAGGHARPVGVGAIGALFGGSCPGSWPAALVREGDRGSQGRCW